MNKTQMILMSAIVAGAQTVGADESGWYGSLNLGYAIPYGSLTPGDGNPDGGPEYDLDNGGVAGLGGGYRLGNGLRLEGELRYRAFDAGGASGGGLGAPSYADGSVTSTTFMTNLAYDFVLKSTKLRPYLKGGIGAAWNEQRRMCSARAVPLDGAVTPRRRIANSPGPWAPVSPIRSMNDCL